MRSAKDWPQSAPPPAPSDCNDHQGKQEPPKRHGVRVRVHKLVVSMRRYEDGKASRNMELKNLKLYLENRSIFEENKKLRQKALILKQENILLISEFHKKFQFSLLQEKIITN